MPADMYSALTDDDVASLIAFIRSQPVGGRTQPPEQETFLKRVMVATGMAPYQAERLLRLPDVRPIDLGPATADGRYIAAITCAQCHGRDLKGSPAPPFVRDFAPPDLRTVSGYTPDTFRAMLRSGRGVADRTLTTHTNQSERFKPLTDVEVDGLYEYLAARAATVG